MSNVKRKRVISNAGKLREKNGREERKGKSCRVENKETYASRACTLQPLVIHYCCYYYRAPFTRRNKSSLQNLTNRRKLICR